MQRSRHFMEVVFKIHRAAILLPIMLFFFFLRNPTRASSMASCSLSEMGKGRQQGFFSFLLQGFFCVQLWSIIIKCLSLDWRGTLSKTAIHQTLQDSSHLTSAAIMPHQVGQLPSLAAEQGAGAGFKIKCAVSGFRSQGLCWLMLY